MNKLFYVPSAITSSCLILLFIMLTMSNLSCRDSKGIFDLAEHGVTSNSEWLPYQYEAEFDGISMVLVPAGATKIGSTEQEIATAIEYCNLSHTGNSDCPTSWFNDELLRTVEFVEPYWIDKTEVTREMYDKCVLADVCDDLGTRNYYLPISVTEPLWPRTQVNWFEAQSFCDWRNGRLPTEAEWEYAARGPDRNVYPWGNSVIGHESNHCDRNCYQSSDMLYPWRSEMHNDGHNYLAIVGSYPVGASWVGALDMAGNASEWVDENYGQLPPPNPPVQGVVLKGGAHFLNQTLLRTSSRGGVQPVEQSESWGFRCMRPYSIEERAID